MSIPALIAVIILGTQPGPQGEATPQSLLDASYQIVDAMPEEAISAYDRDAILWSIAEAQVKAGNLEGALRVAEGINQLRSYRIPLKDYVKTTCEFKAAAQAAREGRRSVADQILKRAIEHCEAIPGDRPSTKGRLLGLWAGVEMMLGNQAETEAILERIREILEKYKKFNRDQNPWIIDLSSIEGSWEELGGVQFRLRLTELIRGGNRDVPDFLLRRLAQERIRSGDEEAGLRVVERIGDPEIHLRALIEAAETLNKLGRVEAAKRTLDRALQNLDAVGNISQRLHVGVWIARTQIRLGRREAALELLAKITPAEGASWSSRYIAPYAVALDEAGEREEAETWLKRAKQVAEARKEEGSRQFDLRDVVRAYVELGELEEANQLANQLDTITNDVLPLVALGWAEAGNLDRALQVLEGVTVLDVRAKATRQIAHALAASEDRTRARDWSERQQNPLLKASALLGSAEGLLERNGPVVFQP